MANQYEDKAAAAAQRASEAGSDLYGKAKEKAHDAVDAGREQAEALYEQGRRQLDAVSETIREWPLLSVGAAFVAGCLISRLFSK